MLAPAGYRTLGQELWREFEATLHGVLQSQDLQPDEDGQEAMSFVGWVNAYIPTYQWYEFNLRLADLLQLVADGTLKRLMVFIPPRHGKSELISRMFTAYYLYRRPEHYVGLCSYGATLARGLSKSARSNFARGGGELRSDSRAAEEWHTTAGGGMWAAGVDGGITGKGAELVVVDDPVKDATEAASPTIQQRNVEWWQSTLRTRFNPGCAIIVVQTRWHEMDLSGWLLKHEFERRRPERWRVVAWEALKEAETPPSTERPEDDLLGLQLATGVDPEKVQRVANYVWPSTVTLEPDWRQPGEALCPERYTAEDLLDIQDGMSAYFWAALFQQRPRPKEGMLFKLEHFSKMVEPHELPAMWVVVRFWDYAATEAAGDFTAGVKIGLGVDGLVYVLHMVRGQWGSAARDDAIRAAMHLDGPGVYQGREQEPGASGKDMALRFHSDYAEHQTFAVRSSGSKFLRADALVAAAQHGRLRLVRGPWTQALIDELVAFGSGSAHDDVADAAAGAYNEATTRLYMLQQAEAQAGSMSLRTWRP